MRDTIDPNASFDSRIEALLEQLRMIEQEIDATGAQGANEKLLGRILDEACIALNDAADARVRQIDAALARMVDGQFGFCESCGAHIDIDRLEEAPTTKTCRSCGP